MKKKRNFRQKAYRIQNGLIIVGATLFIIDAVILGIYFEMTKSEKIMGNETANWYWAIVILTMAVLMLLCLSFVVYVLKDVVIGFRNIRRNCDPVFDDIESYVRHWSHNDHHYVRVIEIINLYYGKEGRVDNEIKQKKQIHRLYSRLDFLRIEKDYYEELKANLMAVVISIVSSGVLVRIQSSFYTEDNMKFFIDITVIFVLVWMVVAITIMGYANRGKDKEGLTFIREYEIKVLTDYINDLEKSFTVKSEDEIALKNQNAVLQQLISMALKKYRNKKAIVEDISAVEKLDLCLESYEEYEFRNCKKCKLHKCNKCKNSVFVMVDDKGDFASNDYGELYNILIKYGWKFEEMGESRMNNLDIVEENKCGRITKGVEKQIGNLYEDFLESRITKQEFEKKVNELLDEKYIKEEDEIERIVLKKMQCQDVKVPLLQFAISILVPILSVLSSMILGLVTITKDNVNTQISILSNSTKVESEILLEGMSDISDSLSKLLFDLNFDVIIMFFTLLFVGVILDWIFAKKRAKKMHFYNMIEIILENRKLRDDKGDKAI